MSEPKIKVLFADGSWVEFNKPQGFDLQQFVHGMRSIGMIITPSFYCPAGMVKALIDMSASEFMYSTAPAPMPNAPTTETPQ